MKSGVLGIGAALTLILGWSVAPSLAATIAGVVACALLVSWAQGRIDPAGLVWGALAGLALLGPTRETFLGGALFGAALYAPRVVRARDKFEGVAIAALALGAGTLLAWLHGLYAFSVASHQWAAFAVAGVGAAIPALIPIDDVIAYTLRRAARRTRGRARIRLLRALVLRRRSELPDGPKAVRDALRAGWTGLAELVGEGERERVALRVRALENAHAAADRLAAARRSLEAGPDQVREAHERLAQELAAFEDLAAA